jgi:hypothetical protein
MKLSRAFIAAAPILISHSLAHAQQSSIQQLQNMQQQQQLSVPMPELRAGTNAPELYEGENADVGPQRILRVGKNAKPRRNYFDVSFDTQIFFTDNANYGSVDQRVSSWVYVNTALAAFAPDPYDLGPGKFAPAIGFSSQWYNYSVSQMIPLDFDAQTAFANLRYLLGNWQFSAGANFTRLATQGSYTESYHEWLPSLGVQRILPLNDTMAFVLGDSIDYHFTKTVSNGQRQDINDHFDNTAYLTFNWQATSHFIVQPFYRFEYSYYQFDTFADNKRNDYLNSVGLTLLYNFNQYVSVRTFYSYTTKISDDKYTPTYDEMNGGIGATLDIRF